MIENMSRSAAPSPEPADYALERTLIPIIVGVVGKRKVGDAATATAVEVALRGILADLRKRHPSSPLLVLTALAEGADWCAARATAAFAESQKRVDGAAPVRLVCPLPLKRALYEQDFSPDHRKAFGRLLQYRTIETAAGEVTLTPEGFSHFELRPLRGAQEAQMARVGDHSGAHRTLHYEQVGLFIADACHLLIAVMPEGEEPCRIGGTARIVHYKCTGRLPPDPVGAKNQPGVHNLMELLERNLPSAPSQATHHALTYRFRRLSEELADPLLPADWFWRRSGHVWQLAPARTRWFCLKGRGLEDETNVAGPVAADHEEVFGLIQPFEAYNRRVKTASKATRDRRQKSIEQFEALTRRVPPSGFDDREQAALMRLFAFRSTISALQGGAKFWADASLWILAGIFVLTVGVFTYYKLWHEKHWAALAYLASLLAAAVWYWIALYKQWSSVHDDYRAAAEALRVQVGWRLAGIRERAESHYRAGTTLQLGRVRTGIETVNTLVALEHRAADIAPPRTLLEVATKQWLDSQISFFTTKHKKRHFENALSLLIVTLLFYFGVGLFVGIVRHIWPAMRKAIGHWFDPMTPFIPAPLLSAAEQLGHVPFGLITAWLLAGLAPFALVAFVLRFRDALLASKHVSGLHNFADRFHDSLTRGLRRGLSVQYRKRLRWVYPLLWGLLPVLPGLWVSLDVLEATFPRHENEIRAEKRLGLIVALLNAAAAAGIYLREKFAIEPEARNYEEMKRVFQLAKDLLAGTSDPAQQRAVLIELGREALAENAYWLRAHRERPIEQIPG